MISERIARRYVRALFGLAGETGVANRIAPELRELQALYRSHSGLRNSMADPRLPQAKKREILRQLLGPDVPRLLIRFIDLLVNKRRLEVLHYAGDLFAQLQDEAAGIRHGHVVSALPLTESQRERLTGTLSRLLDLRVVLTEQVDPMVIGGVMVKVGDLLIDGTIRSRLRGVLGELDHTESTTIR